jgi:antitoxin component YwqK of YwqJK toxin-antitoxin module
MKPILAFILSLTFAVSASATTFYDQLCAFNFNWEKYAAVAPEGEARVMHSEREYIQAHLACVLDILRSENTDHLSAEQKSTRANLVNELAQYRLAGNFPVNYYRTERIPVFIDEHGTHCAVGYLMMKTGHEEMAQRISKADNYVWVKDIHDAEVPAWQEWSGFSVENLKLIQGAYDFYMPNAFYLPNKYETPQQPICTTAYFTDATTGRPLPHTPENLWCKGEGKNGVLNGRWEQNYAVDMPWIVGYYENGKRTGSWEEYYQGTRRLCRTEQWRDHKLNGTRRRYDMSGNVIEEIEFKDGVAICKTNYSLTDSLVYVRVPLDSTHVWTKVLTVDGRLIACGEESVYNPGNLLWFQNIELTALNSAAISARSVNTSGGSNNGNDLNTMGGYAGNNLYNTPQLVTYKKEGYWMYYREKAPAYASVKNITPGNEREMRANYFHYGQTLYASIAMFDLEIQSAYDSIRVFYQANMLQSFYGYSNTNFVHLHVRYYERANTAYQAIYPVSIRGYFPYTFAQPVEFPPAVREIGQYNKRGQRIGEWKYYNSLGAIYKTENYLIPTYVDEVAVN